MVNRCNGIQVVGFLFLWNKGRIFLGGTGRQKVRHDSIDIPVEAARLVGSTA